MKPENELFIKSTLMSGFLYAGLMAAFNYFDGEEFKISKFLFHFFFFGISMGLLSRKLYSHTYSGKWNYNLIEIHTEKYFLSTNFN